MLFCQSLLTKSINTRHFLHRKRLIFSSLKSLLCHTRSLTTQAATARPNVTMHNGEKDNRIVWVDLEMTGLDLENDHIIEIACLITENDLKLVAEGPNLVIHQSDSVLDGMNEWCIQHHGQSGLTEASRNSKIDIKEAEKMVLEFVQQHTPKGKCPIGGNSVSTDREFIAKQMSGLVEHLHFRIIDVSTVKELCRRWYPDEFKAAPAKKKGHRAMDDIRESVEELRYYRQAIFK